MKISIWYDMSRMWRAIRYTIYAILGIVLGGLSFEAATLPRVSVLRDQNPATTSLIETRNREARNSSSQPRRVQRSEERRVGKECRSRGLPDYEKKKEKDHVGGRGYG